MYMYRYISWWFKTPPPPFFYSELKVDFEGTLRQKVAILAVYVTTPAFIYVDMLIVTTRQGLCLSQKNKISSFKIKSWFIDKD